MFKNIFKGAKDLIRSPIGQIGLGILVPGLAGTSGILGGIGSFAAKNPALFQAGLGLLGGAKPQDVLRNVALSAGTAALRGGMSGQGGVSEFFGMQPQMTQQTQQTLAAPTKFQQMQNQMSDFGRSTVSDVIEGATKEGPGFLERVGLIKTGEGLDFFEKYSPLLKLGSVGASVAAAALGEDQARMLYDPEKNPYLTGQVKIQDAYTPAGFNQGGGISDFPEKDGMINGPGDGQSDDIPAMLSDGEFVMTKQAVMAAGNGDRKQGTKAMYNIMNSLEDKAESMGIGRM
jgi:hypothetical protein